MRDLGGTGIATLARPGGRGSMYRAGSTQVVIADDSPLVHLAIRSMLSGVPGYSVAAAASTVAAAEQLVQRVRPELLVCDTSIAGESGVALCRWTRQASPATQVVMLTSCDEPLLVQSALLAGAMGYLLKDSPAEVVLASLCLAASGVQILDERLGAARPRAGTADCVAEAGLSRREREVLDELMLGLDNKAIAIRLCISEDTVKSHVKAIFRKLGARDRAHAVALALGSAAPAVAARTRAGQPAGQSGAAPGQSGAGPGQSGAGRGRSGAAAAEAGLPRPRLAVR
jgi:DNA-binding NarL/FixJ family response regulator